MIGRLLQFAGPILTYFCVATVIAQVIGLLAVWSSGRMDREKAFRMMAVAYNVDLDGDDTEKLDEATREDASINQVLQARAIKHFEIDMRQQAIDQGLDDLRNMQNQLMEERKRYDQLRDSFFAKLQELQHGAEKSSIMEVQRTLEAIHPRQAKEQILKMLDENAMYDVVAIMKAMPLDRRKKIIAEFKTEQEAEKLADILREIRMGVPEIPLYKETKKRLEQFNPETT